MSKIYKTSSVPNPKTYDARVCSFNISIGNLLQVGEKLSSTIQWANSRFDKVIINLGDGLQRHNYMTDGLSESAAVAKAQMVGDLWLTEQQEVLNSFEIPFEIKRWNDWLELEEVQDKIEMAHLFYQSDKGMQEALNSDVTRFAAKFNRDITDHNVNFILEEIGIHSYMAETIPHLAFAYPYGSLNCYKYLRTYPFGKEIGLSKGLFVQTLTRKRKSVDPQVNNTQPIKAHPLTL